VLFFGGFCYFSVFFPVAPLPGRCLIVLFFGFFANFWSCFSLGPPGNFSADALEQSWKYFANEQKIPNKIKLFFIKQKNILQRLVKRVNVLNNRPYSKSKLELKSNTSDAKNFPSVLYLSVLHLKPKLQVPVLMFEFLSNWVRARVSSKIFETETRHWRYETETWTCRDFWNQMFRKCYELF